VSGGLIERWKYEQEANAAEAFPGQGKRTAEQRQIHELESENRLLRMERDILKNHGLLCQRKRMRCRFIDV
jgi:transposase-like protein